MLAVEALGINPIKVAHATGKITVGGVNQKVIMVGHQAEGRNLQVPHLCRIFRHPSEETEKYIL